MGGPQFDRNFGGYRVFCGDLGSRTNKFELEREFDTFGPLVDCWVARNPPGFAFIVYKHADDAERAVEELDGRTICGRRVRVEHARPTGGKKGGSFGRGYLRQRSPGYRSPDTKRDDDDRRPSRRDRKRSPSRSRSRSSSHEERRSSRRHRRSRSHSRSKKESKRKRRSSSSRSPVEKKTRQRSSSRERSSTPVDKNRDHGSRSPSKDDNKKETKKNDTDKSNNEKIDNDDNDESRSSPTPGESETKNNDDD
ncbi:unnamed protein product [Rotaria magnacalcarata]|uniref:RRM domain-containing protein n=1 Tax=Rotaria magnacalcarata TaxID=392030 RepID=A0A814DLX4_9BILA|nr:unnamed protein product [Rotaria magnacalcarata]CAF1668292.1 unnamed protein product [Rotaria magnacalcarata]CAF2104021.1 unnamed protein product [Rotaria magnacalcarata]CAF3836734.1 unnamed protein product [Rotaria magnacalcarata]CAF4013362.1 unnamed protein product [Rotaria magnacalcarata]